MRRKNKKNDVLVTEIDATLPEFTNLSLQNKKALKNYIKSVHVKDLFANKMYLGCYAEDFYKCPLIAVSEASHRVSKLYFKNNCLKANIQILDTPKGHELLRELTRIDYKTIITEDKDNILDLIILVERRKI